MSDQWNMGQVILGLLLAGVMAISGWTLSSIHELSSDMAVVNVKLEGLQTQMDGQKVSSEVISSLSWKQGENNGAIEQLNKAMRSNWPRDRAQDQNDQIFKRHLERLHPGVDVELRVIEEH